MRRTPVWIAIVHLAAGCTANNEHALYNEVGHIVPYAMIGGQSETMADAEKALQGVGFHCGPTHSLILPPPIRDCSRLRNYAVLATCVQTVILVPGQDPAVLSYYYVPRILCAGI
jgi:hypothetical protein